MNLKFQWLTYSWTLLIIAVLAVCINVSISTSLSNCACEQKLQALTYVRMIIFCLSMTNIIWLNHQRIALLDEVLEITIVEFWIPYLFLICPCSTCNCHDCQVTRQKKLLWRGQAKPPLQHILTWEDIMMLSSACRQLKYTLRNDLHTIQPIYQIWYCLLYNIHRSTWWQNAVIALYISLALWINTTYGWIGFTQIIIFRTEPILGQQSLNSFACSCTFYIFCNLEWNKLIFLMTQLLYQSRRLGLS